VTPTKTGDYGFCDHDCDLGHGLDYGSSGGDFDYACGYGFGLDYDQTRRLHLEIVKRP
jgi:hypothetical protein